MTEIDRAKIDRAEIAAAMLREALPGFKTNIDAAADAIMIRGTFRVGGGIPVESLYFAVPVPRGFGLDGIPTNQEAEARRAVAPVVERLVKSTRSIAIEALGIEAEIEARVAKARERALAEGFEKGHLEGYDAGHRDGAEAMRQALLDATGGA
jgi:hypothetical protein